MNHKVTLVLGGTGKTGRRLAQRLERRGATVRLGSRAAAPAFDWQRQETWEPALEGVSAVYLTYQPDLALPAAAEHVREFAELGVRRGARRIVLLSGRGAVGALASEQALRDSGADWSVIRAAWFSQNFSEGHLLAPVLAGEIAFPAGSVEEPFVDVDDIADVAVELLENGSGVGATFELTGPRLLSFADAAQEIARACGRDVRYLPVAPEAYANALETQMPSEEAAFLSALFAELLDGRNAKLADGVERALGRPPRDFAEYARDAAASGVWAR